MTNPLLGLSIGELGQKLRSGETKPTILARAAMDALDSNGHLQINDTSKNNAVLRAEQIVNIFFVRHHYCYSQLRSFYSNHIR